MYAITGALGQTGSTVANALLATGVPVRLIVRSEDSRAAHWRARGAEIAVADLTDTSRLARAFEGVTGAYLMNPPNYMASDMFVEARRVHGSLIAAANHAAVEHVVALSSVGAHQPLGTGNIGTTWDFERKLDGLKSRVSVLRAANFMENWAWSLQPVLTQGVLPTMFLPPDRPLTMVAARDIGAAAAQSLKSPRAASARCSMGSTTARWCSNARWATPLAVSPVAAPQRRWIPSKPMPSMWRWPAAKSNGSDFPAELRFIMDISKTSCLGWSLDTNWRSLMASRPNRLS
ncbi:MAG: NmrA family NAD(P)-binding protein [Ideonella sp.]